MKFENILKYRPKLTRRNIVIALVLLMIIASIYQFFIAPNRQKDPPQATSVKRQTIQQSISASGTLTGKETANLHFLSAGKLAEVAVKEGDRIEKDTKVASLDMQQLSINLAQAQNNLRSAQANVDKIIDDIHLNQYGNGGFDKVGSPEETQTQRNQRTAAEVSRDNAVDTLRTSQRAFQDALLLSPIAGIVTQTTPVQGQNVTAADLVAQVVDDTEIYLDAEVDEADIGNVSPGQQVNVTLNTYPDKTFHGVVSQIIPNTKTTTSGATVVITRVKLYEQSINFIANVNGQANIVTKESQNALTIPQDALVEDKFVYIKEGNNHKKVEVKTGISSETDVEILEGLTEGQQVVINPQVLEK